MLGEPHYGALGSVMKIDPEHKGRIQLRFTVSAEPDFRQLFSQQAQLHEKYETGRSTLVLPKENVRLIWKRSFLPLMLKEPSKSLQILLKNSFVHPKQKYRYLL